MTLKPSQGALHGGAAKPNYWRRFVNNLLFMAVLCFLGYIYLAVAVVYDLTAGDGIGPGVRWLALVLGVGIVLGALYLAALGDEADQPAPRRKIPDRTPALGFEPRLIAQLSQARWKATHRQVNRFRRRRIGAVCLWIPVAVGCTAGLAVGGALDLDRWLPERPWAMIPVLIVFVGTVLLMSATALNTLATDVQNQPAFVVGVVTGRVKLTEPPGVLNTIPVLIGIRGGGVQLSVTNRFRLHADGSLGSLPREAQDDEFPCTAGLRRRLAVGDAVVLLVMPDGRAVARLVDL